ncbi:MAG: nucleotidyltransferase family protein [Fusobacteriaceae bacterium]|jgi:predicted nucleotidyltransferase|nr:nucleotidyltransferase family protein [Fusobacteriaceae bacterium]
MNATGLIVEYNPFHNGHLYHLKKVIEIDKDSVKIAVMSGDFVQRGEPAIIDKDVRAKIAIENGIDIVVELPVFYSCQSAEIFAIGAVGILNEIGCKNLIFGSESNDIEKLKKILELTEADEFKIKMKEALNAGNSYPTAYDMALNIDSKLASNDILGLEYIKAIKNLRSDIIPITIKREKTFYYEDKIIDNFASGTKIRALIKNNEAIDKVVPENTYKVLREIDKENKIPYLEDYYALIRYQIINNYEKLKYIQDIEIGFENRLYQMACKYEEIYDFFSNIITKRISIGRAQRILIHILIDLTVQITDIVKKDIPYVKIIDYSKKGQTYLNFIKKFKNKKIISTYKNITKNFSKQQIDMIEFNRKANVIYKLKNKK